MLLIGLQLKFIQVTITLFIVFFVDEDNKTILYCNTGKGSQGGSDVYLSVYAIGTLEIA
nr:MAG TPA: hypothetical protein [Caudoviricetes sp.]